MTPDFANDNIIYLLLPIYFSNILKLSSIRILSDLHMLKQQAFNDLIHCNNMENTSPSTRDPSSKSRV